MRRVYLAGVVLGATLALAVWLATYRVTTTYEWIDSLGRRFHPSEQFSVSPWWSVPGAVALLLVGSATSLWLLPDRRGVTRRLADYFSRLAGGAVHQLPHN